jgi:hypothetical protein
MIMTVMTRKLSADEAMSLRRDQLRGDRLVKTASSAPASWNASTRSARFTMTSAAKDRYGDMVMTDGIDTTEFLRNPVAFFSHNSASWPIGRWTNLQKYLFANPNRMDGTLELAPSGGPIAEIDQAAWSIEHGMLRAASVGFLPDWSSVEKILEEGTWTGGLQFNQCELIECSLCGIPANPDALAKGMGKLSKFALGHDLPSQVRQRKREIELAVIKQRGPTR